MSAYLDRPCRELAEVPSARSAMMKRETREISSVGEWLEWRRQDVTASNIAALFDCHPFMTRSKLIAEMNGALRLESYVMQRGRALEASVVAGLPDEYPDWQIAKATTYHRLPDHRLGCSPDYWLNENALIQCKRIGAKKWIKYGERPPLAFMLQTLTELLVTDREYGILAVTIGEPAKSRKLYRIPRHPAAERRILDAVAEFWATRDEPKTLKEVLSEALEAIDA